MRSADDNLLLSIEQVFDFRGVKNFREKPDSTKKFGLSHFTRSCFLRMRKKKLGFEFYVIGFFSVVLLAPPVKARMSKKKMGLEPCHDRKNFVRSRVVNEKICVEPHSTLKNLCTHPCVKRTPFRSVMHLCTD